ncbi:MAG: hypothetical protein RSE91_01885 [Bacilli bacterium]
MNSYLIPANTKRGTLIFGVFREFDLILFCVGIGVSLLLLLIVGADTTKTVVITLTPALVCSLLVAPVPYYHNILVLIMEGWAFITNRQRYIWKGWCVEYGEENK